MSCFAFKFLAHGAIGTISELAWPTPKAGRPGNWVEVREPLRLCESGVHAFAATELAHWLHDELWVIELDGRLIAGHDSLVAERARLTRHVEAWRDGGAVRFAHAARDHALSLVANAPVALRAELQAYAADAAAHVPRGSIALAAYGAAMTVARLPGGGTKFDEVGYRQERSWQSKFIANDLRLALPAN